MLPQGALEWFKSAFKQVPVRVLSSGIGTISFLKAMLCNYLLKIPESCVHQQVPATLFSQNKHSLTRIPHYEHQMSPNIFFAHIKNSVLPILMSHCPGILSIDSGIGWPRLIAACMNHHMIVGIFHTQMKHFARVQTNYALKFSQSSNPAGLNEMNGDLRPKWSSLQLIIAISFTPAWANLDPNRLLVMETRGEIEETMGVTN